MGKNVGKEGGAKGGIDRRRALALALTAVGSVATGGTPLPQVNFDRSPVALFLGSEPFGLPEPVTSRMDRLVTVPMPGEVDSFSVNAAAAILLYEIGRGR